MRITSCQGVYSNALIKVKMLRLIKTMVLASGIKYTYTSGHINEISRRQLKDFGKLMNLNNKKCNGLDLTH